MGLYPKTWAAILFYWSHGRLLELLNPEGSLLQVVRSFKQVSELNTERIEQMTDEVVSQDIRDHGGIGEVLAFFADADNFVESQMERFSEIFEQSYLSGMGPGGNGYEFNEKEVAFITEQAQAFYTILEREAHKVYLEALKGAQGIKDSRMAGELAEFLVSKAQHYVMRTTDATIQGSIKRENKHVPVDVPEFAYSYDLRRSAAGLLYGPMDNPFWAKLEKSRLRKEYRTFLDAIFGGEENAFSEVQEKDLSSSLLRWFWEQQNILGQI